MNAAPATMGWHNPDLLGDLRLIAVTAVAIVFIFAPISLLRVRTSPLKRAWSWHIKPTHALPALIQTLLFTYWALYWRELSFHIPAIGCLVVVAYALDAGLSMARYGHWRIGFGPVPMVFSLHLFAIWGHGEIHNSLAAVVIAVSSKHVLRRGDRHLFNPSGLGIAVVGLLNIFFPALGDGDIAHEFNLPPNMAELIVLLAIIVQTRVPVVLVTIAATATMLVFSTLTGIGAFAPQWAPVTLVIVLLFTDPATSPHTPLGKIMFGALAGLLMQSMAAVMPGAPEFFYAKVLPIPLVNLAAPWCDRAGYIIAGRARWLANALHPRFNKRHVAVWLLVAAALIIADKRPQLGPGHPEPELHQYNRTEAIIYSADNTVRCVDNPVYCRPFSFVAEAQMWAKGRQ